MTRLHAVSQRTREYLARARPLLVGERWIETDDAHLVSAIDPATGEAIGRFYCARESELHDAVAAARRSFDDSRWRSLTPARRQQVLWKVADLIDASAEQFAELESLDGGKLYASAFQHEVPHAAETF